MSANRMRCTSLAFVSLAFAQALGVLPHAYTETTNFVPRPDPPPNAEFVITASPEAGPPAPSDAKPTGPANSSPEPQEDGSAIKGGTDEVQVLKEKMI